MTSYSAEVCENKIKEYKNFLKEGCLGNTKILYGKVPSITDGYLYKRRKMLKESPVELYVNGEMLMSLSVKEIQGATEAIRKAKGKCGVLGLGLGYYVQEIAKKEEVTEIIVYEKNKDVIELYNQNFATNKKIKIQNEDGFATKREEFDFFFADIYSYNLDCEVAKDYLKLMKLHNICIYTFFGVEKFLLSCPLEDLTTVFIPEEWMEMAKRSFDNVDKIGQTKNIKNLRRNKALEILECFRPILNEE
ncbi:MAG: hypothetical protein ACRDDL_03395 [Sarcina sp.]